jgi:hypothetical protein
MKIKLNVKTVIVIALLFVWTIVTLPLAILAFAGLKIQQHLIKVMPKHHFEQGIMLQAPQSVWHKFLGWFATFLIGEGSTTCAISPKKEGDQWYISICTKVSRITLWHELAHCVEKEAQPKGWGSLLDHMDKGARYEKRADLFAFRKAFKELSPEEASREIRNWCAMLRRASRFDFGLTDCKWRAKLAERYIRRYYQQ